MEYPFICISAALIPEDMMSERCGKLSYVKYRII